MPFSHFTYIFYLRQQTQIVSACICFCFADCDPTREDGFHGNDLLHSSQESLLAMTEDSISSMDIDLNALEKVSNTFCLSFW